jgi:predicted negative regulator of RcsB-dependent stress response
VQSYTRHKLKEDRFAAATKEAVHWSVEHRGTIIALVVVALLAIGSWIGYSVWINNQNTKASEELGRAVRTYTAEVRQAGIPATPETESYASATERAQAAQRKFMEVADKYPRTQNGKYARYMAGVSAIQAGDAAKGEQLLKDASGYGKELSALAKFALASFYRTNGKQDDATRLYKEVADAKTTSVPRSTAQLELAEMLEQKNPAEAIKTYEQLAKEEEEQRKQAKDVSGPQTQPTAIEDIATRKIKELKEKTKS